LVLANDVLPYHRRCLNEDDYQSQKVGSTEESTELFLNAIKHDRYKKQKPSEWEGLLPQQLNGI